MPTLEQVVALARGHGELPRFNIETKISPLAPDETAGPEHFARTLIAEIRRLDIAARSSIQSFDWRTLAVVAREAPEIARVHLTSERGGSETVFKGKGRSPWTGIDAAAHGDSTPRVVAAAGGQALVAVLPRPDAPRPSPRRSGWDSSSCPGRSTSRRRCVGHRGARRRRADHRLPGRCARRAA
jgi:glycerophosphoryl diester phosphodiesterase